MLTRRPAHEHGGVERVVRDLTAELEQQNLEWSVETVSAFRRSGGLEAINVANDIAAALILALRTVRGRYDVAFVHCPECLWGPLLARRLARTRTSLIAVWHGAGRNPALVLRPPGHPLARALAWFRSREERLALRADAHVAVHQSVVDELRNQYGFTDDVTVAENALPAPGKAVARETARSGVRALWIGQSGHRKGLDVALEAVRLARRSRSDIELLVAGVPPGPRTDGVTWCGVVPPSQVQRLHADADLLLFPTRYESFGLVVLEAMASGLPLIVSHAVPGGIMEDGRNGVMIEGHDAQAYSDALLHFCDDAELRHRIAAVNREDSKRFDLSATARRYTNTAERLATAAR